MIIDITFLVLLCVAVMKGYSKGLIVALFSLIAFIVGLAAAVKFSAIVAGWLGTQVSVAQQWLPMLSFAIVFIGVVFLVRLGAKMLEKTVQFAMLGWLNKIGGIFFYMLLYTILLSLFLFYTKQLNVITSATIAQSQTYNFIEPFGQKVINSIGTVVPIFKNLFAQLEQFFDTIKTAK